VLRGRSKYAGRTSTSSEMPRFVQSSVVSSVPSTRRRSGTGSIPQLGVSCKGAGSVPPTVIRSSLFVLALLLVLAGCGSSPKTVTKAEYQRELQRLGQDLTDAGSQLGQSIDIATFNQNVDNLHDHLRDAADELRGMKPPADVQAANKRLADALDDFADQLDSVKDARRESIVRARAALLRVSKSEGVREARAATRELKRKGYEIGQFGAL